MIVLYITGLALGSSNNQENEKPFGYDSGELGKNQILVKSTFVEKTPNFNSLVFK